MDIGGTINIIHDGGDFTSLNTRQVSWDPTSGIYVTSGDVQSAAIGLLHEVGHLTVPGGDGSTPDAQYTDSGDRQVITTLENPAAAQLGDVQRADHFGEPVILTDSTSHTDTSDQPQAGGDYNFWGDNTDYSSGEFGGYGGGGSWRDSYVQDQRTGYVKQAYYHATHNGGGGGGGGGGGNPIP